MMWNYRVSRIQDEGTESGFVLGVQEVYYDENGQPTSWGDPFIFGNDIAELGRVLDKMRGALEKPILEL